MPKTLNLSRLYGWVSGISTTHNLKEMMKVKKDLRADVASHILQWLNVDLSPWRTKIGNPVNVSGCKKYKGINALILNCFASERNFTSVYWGAMPSWSNKNIFIKKKPDSVEKGAYAAKIFKDDMGKTYPVFNTEHCCGLNLKLYSGSLKLNEDYSLIEKIIKATNIAIFENSSNIAIFDFGDLSIHIPKRASLFSDTQYYGILIHELSHWVESQTGWEGEEHKSELIAEMATSFLRGELNLPDDDDFANHKLYVSKWKDHIHEDPNYLFEAAAQASKNVDHLLNLVGLQR